MSNLLEIILYIVVSFSFSTYLWHYLMSTLKATLFYPIELVVRYLILSLLYCVPLNVGMYILAWNMRDEKKRISFMAGLVAVIIFWFISYVQISAISFVIYGLFRQFVLLA